MLVAGHFFQKDDLCPLTIVTRLHILNVAIGISGLSIPGRRRRKAIVTRRHGSQQLLVLSGKLILPRNQQTADVYFHLEK